MMRSWASLLNCSVCIDRKIRGIPFASDCGEKVGDKLRTLIRQKRARNWNRIFDTWGAQAHTRKIMCHGAEYETEGNRFRVRAITLYCITEGNPLKGKYRIIQQAKQPAAINMAITQCQLSDSKVSLGLKYTFTAFDRDWKFALTKFVPGSQASLTFLMIHSSNVPFLFQHMYHANASVQLEISWDNLETWRTALIFTVSVDLLHLHNFTH